MHLTFTVVGPGFATITADLEKIASGVHAAGLAKALNRVGDKVEKRTLRELAKQVGLSKGELFRNGRVLRIGRASSSHLAFEVHTSGRAIKAIELKHWVRPRPKQGRDARGRFLAIPDGAGGGVKLGGWARGKIVRSGFKIAAGVAWGGGSKKADGLYYRPDRGDKRRFGGFRTMYGANLNKQLVSDETRRAFEDVVNGSGGLGYEVGRELRQILRGFG